jgi:beta-lactamase class A
VIIGTDSSITTMAEQILPPTDTTKKINYSFGKLNINNSSVTLTADMFSNLNTYISRYPRASGIYVINLSDNMSFSYNADKYMFAASTVKLPFLYYCMDKIQSGQYKLTDTILYREKFRRGGTGLLQYYDSGSYWSIKTLIEYTIIYSDNVAYYMLLDHFGYSGYNSMLENDGFETYINSNIKFGNVSPKLMAFYWQKIYNAYQNNPDLWKTIVNSGCKTTYSPIRDRISNIPISNKTGWATASYHDSAIVFSENNYVIVVMTTGEGYTSDYNYICNIAGEVDKIIESYNSGKD